MNELRQAAEMALNALRYTTDHLPAKTGVEREVDDAITALQIALAKPEMKELTAHDRYQERQRIAEEQHIKRIKTHETKSDRSEGAGLSTRTTDSTRDRKPPGL